MEFQSVERWTIVVSDAPVDEVDHAASSLLSPHYIIQPQSDESKHPTGLKVPNEEMESINIETANFH